MARTLDPQTKAELSARLAFYRELGIYGMYRRPVSADAAITELAEPVAVEESLPNNKTVFDTSENALKVLPSASKAEGLVAIREDIGDCTRCVLHKQGRKQIVFGVGNPEAE